MKKSVLLIGLTSILGVGGLVGCSKIIDNKDSTPISKKQSLSMQAATSLSMLNKTSSSNVKMSKKVDVEQTLTEEEKAEIKEILPTLDLMLTNSSSFDAVIETGDYKPVAEDTTILFNTKEVISFLGTDGKQSSYTLYYNIESDKPADSVEPTDPVTPDETVEPTDPTTPDETVEPTDPTTPNDSTDAEKPTEPDASGEVTGDTPKKAAELQEKDDEEENDKEADDQNKEDTSKITIENAIEGLAFLNEETYYPFKSEVETETSADETEEERTFEITTGKDSFIKVEQEHEIENGKKETEFAYTVVENGEVTLDYSIEIETEEDQIELGYEIGGKEYELTKEEVNGETLYHVEYENEETDVEALVTFKKIVNEDGSIDYTLA